MKKYRPALLILGYCIPYSFLALYFDCTCKWQWGYFPAILIPVLLCWINGKFTGFSNAIKGNLLSSLISALLSYRFLTEFDSYFKPFGAVLFSFALCLFSFMLQVLLWSRKKQLEPAQSLLVAVCAVAVGMVLLFLVISWLSLQRISG